MVVDWLLTIVYEESMTSDIGRACLMDTIYGRQDAILHVRRLLCASW